MLKRRRNARCTAVADSVLMNSGAQNILSCVVAVLLSTDVAARLYARRALQRQYMKIQDLLFQTLRRSFTYLVQFRKYRRTKLSPSFLITLYKQQDILNLNIEATDSSETVTYQTTQHHSTEDFTHNSYSCKNLKSNHKTVCGERGSVLDRLKS